VFVSHTILPAPADRFAFIIEGLCQAVARSLGGGLAGPRLAGPFIILIWSRLRRITARFARHALTLSRPPAIRPALIAAAVKPRAKRSNTASFPLPRPLLPRNRAWLLRLVPETASGASQLRHFLADPEVAALLATAPQLHRILRPLCHMLGIRAAAVLSHPAPPPGAPSDAPAIPCHAPKQAAPAASSLVPSPPIPVPPWKPPPSSPRAPPHTPAPRRLA
jgi:hypothetical protein